MRLRYTHGAGCQDEEMFFGHEVAIPTEHPKILRARNGHEQYCTDETINALVDAAVAGASDETLRGRLQFIVPDFAGSGIIEPARAPVAEVASETTPIRKPTKLSERLSAEASPA